MLLNSAKCQGYSFYCFWVIKGKPKGGILLLHPPRLGLKDIQRSMSMLLDTRFHIWLIMTLHYKMRQILLQNAAAILLQNASGFLLQTATVLLQIVTVLLQNATFTNCDSTTAHSVFGGFFLSFCLFFFVLRYSDALWTLSEILFYVIFVFIK